MGTNAEGFVGIVLTKVSTIIDARGRTKQLAVVPCPEPRCRGLHSLIIAIRGLEPLHFTLAEAFDLVEQLRDGPKSPRLQLSPFQSGRVFAVTQLPTGRVLIAFDLDGTCDLIIAGGPPELVATGMSATLSPEHRLAWAEVISRELALETGALDGKVARA